MGMRFSINIPNFGDFADARTYLGCLDAGAQLVGFAGSVDVDVAAEGDYSELERRAIEVIRRLDAYTSK